MLGALARGPGIVRADRTAGQCIAAEYRPATGRGPAVLRAADRVLGEHPDPGRNAMAVQKAIAVSEAGRTIAGIDASHMCAVAAGGRVVAGVGLVAAGVVDAADNARVVIAVTVPGARIGGCPDHAAAVQTNAGQPGRVAGERGIVAVDVVGHHLGGAFIFKLGLGTQVAQRDHLGQRRDRIQPGCIDFCDHVVQPLIGLCRPGVEDSDAGSFQFVQGRVEVSVVVDVNVDIADACAAVLQARLQFERRVQPTNVAHEVMRGRRIASAAVTPGEVGEPGKWLKQVQAGGSQGLQIGGQGRATQLNQRQGIARDRSRRIARHPSLRVEKSPVQADAVG